MFPHTEAICKSITCDLDKQPFPTRNDTHQTEPVVEPRESSSRELKHGPDPLTAPLTVPQESASVLRLLPCDVRELTRAQRAFHSTLAI